MYCSKSWKKTLLKVHLPTNSGVPCIVLMAIPGFNSLASPKSINLISQVSLLMQTIFSGYNENINTCKSIHGKYIYTFMHLDHNHS